jgi:thiol-disulfide isomerase/thioredoxin
VPDVELTDLTLERRLSTRELVDGRRAVLVFLSSDCPACEELLPALGRWQDTLRSSLPVIAIGSGDPDAYREDAERHRLAPVLVGTEETLRAFNVGVTPSAVALGPGAVIEGRTAEGLQEVESLVRRALRT